MSRLRTTKISQPSNPPANTCEYYYDTTLSKPCVVDQSGNQIVLGGFAAKDYRLIKVVEVFQGTVTYTPTSNAKALYVECIGGGGSGGGVATAATNSGAAGGGGG